MKFAKISRSILNHAMLKAIGVYDASVPFYCKMLTQNEIDTLDNPVKVYLSVSNVRALISKLDRVLEGDHSYCTIIKRDTVHPVYPCSHETSVTAVEDDAAFTDINFIFYVVNDDAYYANRAAGEIHPKDRSMCMQCHGTGLIEGLDSYGGGQSFETCPCKLDKKDR